MAINFVPYFKKRFSGQDRQMFTNENLTFDIDDEMDAKAKVQAFAEYVTSPLSDNIFDEVERFQSRASMIALSNEVDFVKSLKQSVDRPQSQNADEMQGSGSSSTAPVTFQSAKEAAMKPLIGMADRNQSEPCIELMSQGKIDID